MEGLKYNRVRLPPSIGHNTMKGGFTLQGLRKVTQGLICFLNCLDYTCSRLPIALVSLESLLIFLPGRWHISTVPTPRTEVKKLPISSRQSYLHSQTLAQKIKIMIRWNKGRICFWASLRLRFIIWTVHMMIHHPFMVKTTLAHKVL